MNNLRTALTYLTYGDEEAKSLVQVFHMSGILDGTVHSRAMDTAVLEEALDSKLGLSRINCSVPKIAARFNYLGQEKFRSMRGSGERQEMQKVPSPGEGFAKHIENLNMIDEVRPKKDTEVFMLFGATEAGLKNRMNFLREHLSKEELQKKEIILLGGARNVWPKYTGNDEELSKLIPGEESTFRLVSKLNPTIDIMALKQKINEFFEEKKEELKRGDTTVGKLRIDISSKVAGKVLWPTESHLEGMLAREILESKKVSIIEGRVDPSIGRPTSITSLEEVSKLNDTQKSKSYCVVSSAPYIRRQTEQAISISGIANLTGCGRGCPSLLSDSSNVSSVLEATIGEVNALYKIATERSRKQEASLR